MDQRHPAGSWPQRYTVALLVGSWTLSGIALIQPDAASAFSTSPSTITFSATTSNPIPPSQTVAFSRRSLAARTWTASADAAWIGISPATGIMSSGQEQISVQVNATGLAAGTYNGSLRIAVGEGNKRNQTAVVSVTLMVTTTGSTQSISTPSMLFNPSSLSFLGTAGGAMPLAKTINVANPTGGTLTWTLSESASWLGLNITSGTTTTETDQVSASVSIQGLAAGTYNTVITATAAGASNSPQTIPVSLTLNSATTAGSVSLSWAANTESDLAGYKVYIGTQPGIYGSPVSVGMATSYVAGNLKSGTTYYFSITACDTAGNESEHSNEVSKQIF